MFLDEPTAGLDPAARRMTWAHVRELQAEGVTVVLTTHLLDEAEELADTVVIIDHGRVVARGTPAELTHGEQADLAFSAGPGLDVADLGAALGVEVVEQRPGQYLVAGAPSPRLVSELTGWLAAHDAQLGELRAGKRTLEDVFLRLTSEDSVAARDAGRAGHHDASRRRGRGRR